ncbi:MAG: hypothetical protein IJO63_03105 [Bacilli bacterium]|nr:hypothetical protein [Bacilli bacterium]
MEDLKELIASFPRDEGIRYFYHFTPSFPEDLVEQGIIVANPRWEQSFLEFTNNELDDIESVINDNKSTKVKQNRAMIIVAVYEDEMEKFIRPIANDYVNTVYWEGVGSPDYIVDSANIIGYIDLETLTFVLNDFANVELSSNRLY